MAVRRTAAAAAAAPKLGGSVNFGEDTFYFGGLGIPEGDYAMWFTSQMFQPTKLNGQPSGAAFLAIMGECFPIDKEGNIIGEALDPHPFGMGQKAHLGFVPSEDGKGLERVAGGDASGMNNSTNWALFRKSLRDCGMSAEYLKNDLRVLDGIGLHLKPMPEPEDRKKFGSATGAAALDPTAQQDNRPKLIPTAMEVFIAPWKGESVDRPDATAAPAAKTRKTPAAAPAPVGEVTELGDEEMMEAAQNCITDVLVKNPAGISKLQLRIKTFEVAEKKVGADIANAIVEQFFASDEAITSVIASLDYVVKGAQVVPK